MTNIVVVDDDEIICDFVADTLDNAGYKTWVVRDGSYAMAKIELECPDMVLLDCSMPDRPGISILQELKNDPAFMKIPVVMMTARRSPWFVKIARNLGARGYLKKPFSTEDLCATVSACLENDGPMFGIGNEKTGSLG